MVEAPERSAVLQSLIEVNAADFTALLYFALNALFLNGTSGKSAINTNANVSIWSIAQLVHYWVGGAIYASFFFINFAVLLGIAPAGSIALDISEYVYGYFFPVWLLAYSVLTILTLENVRTTLTAGVDANALALMQFVATEYGGLLGVMGANALTWNSNYDNWRYEAERLKALSGGDEKVEEAEAENLLGF